MKSHHVSVADEQTVASGDLQGRFREDSDYSHFPPAYDLLELAAQNEWKVTSADSVEGEDSETCGESGETACKEVRTARDKLAEMNDPPRLSAPADVEAERRIHCGGCC